MGRVARAFWTTLEKDAALRKKCMAEVCKKILSEEGLSNNNKRKRK
jgi:predicted DNA-binding ribbon-helix-helix protein